MGDPRAKDERLRILNYWWTIELFSPQSVPKLTRRATSPARKQVIEWRPDEPLPWQQLPPPKPIHGKPLVWRHTVYLGIYELEATYESLHRVFGEDPDAYDERPGGKSACAGLLIDDAGRLLLDSAVLSSALWAVARIHDPGPGDPNWMNGFNAAGEAFIDALDKYERKRRDSIGAEQQLPCDAESLRGLLKIAHQSAGVSGLEDLASERVVIKSVAVSERRGEETTKIDFLNSFFLEDLANVRDQVARDNVGQAIDTYLTGDDSLRPGERVDVVKTVEAVDAGTAIDRLPKGRWPSNPEHSLALSQQFAVNEAMNSLNVSPGLTGVNGPPGTGKTTMLRDILAANVVQRARRLAALEKAEDAFTDHKNTHRWTSGGHPRSVRQLRPELTGFEMVVAAANNTAVENITNEIPVQTAIDERWRDSADYFGAIATKVLRKTSTDSETHGTDQRQAWGLVAARLGKKRNRSDFRSAFWFDADEAETTRSVEDVVPGMQTLLNQWRNGAEPPKAWDQARVAFARAEEKVDALVQQRREAEKRRQEMARLAKRRRALTDDIEETSNRLGQLEQDAKRHRPIERQAEAALAQAMAQHDRHLSAKPGALETIFSLGRAVRDWRSGLQPLVQALHAAEERHHEEVAVRQNLEDSRGQLADRLSAAKSDLAITRDTHEKRQVECDRDATKYGDAYPGDDIANERRELHAPWLDSELDTARSELFLAALQLHKDFVANTASDMVKGLRAASDVVAGIYPHDLESAKLQAAWQLFFLVVPLVSTTFASASRMFGGMGRESIGWLLIDEAGQASPQYAAGAIWRAQRVVAVGDPLQLEPVVTIPQKAQHDIASNYDVSATWIPPRASVQTLADRVTKFGTTLGQGESEVWVSAPLRVHRRCDDPMFTLCNKIAYDGIMVNGVHRDPDKPDPFASNDASTPAIKPSHWADEPARNPGSHLQRNQIERLEIILGDLDSHGIDASQVIAISPFREVANHLFELAETRYKGLRAGTIHVAQGREAPVVILVLGGDPNKDGAKRWAAESPNLVNVAASRAQRRLYVIGDRAAWKRHNYFEQLSKMLG